MWSFERRAVVPPDDLAKSRDIAVPTPSHAQQSPFPFGVGLYTSPRYGRNKLLPLLFVPAKAAADRSEMTSIKEGWYVIARPGLNFEIRTTRVNGQGSAHDTAFTTYLYVDGKYTNQSHTFNPGLHAEFVTTGFVQDSGRLQKGKSEHKGNKFIFRKTVTSGTGKQGESKTGSVQMEVYCGKTQLNQFNGRDGEHVNRKESGQSSCFVPVQKKLPNATVTVYIREASWMRSMQLIDDEGTPCTYEMYLGLKKKDKIQNDSSLIRPRLKMQGETARKRMKLHTEVGDEEK